MTLYLSNCRDFLGTLRSSFSLGSQNIIISVHNEAFAEQPMTFFLSLLVRNVLTPDACDSVQCSRLREIQSASDGIGIVRTLQKNCSMLPSSPCGLLPGPRLITRVGPFLSCLAGSLIVLMCVIRT